MQALSKNTPQRRARAARFIATSLDIFQQAWYNHFIVIKIIFERIDGFIMANTPPAYEGNKPYIFISYAHKDTEKVLPAIDALERAGYPVWYDAGIAVGSEWPDYIARHLLNASLVIAFISASSIASQNCRQEVVYALDKHKNMITVRLDDAQLPPGMEMQLNLCQGLLAYRHATEEGYIAELVNAPFIAEALGMTPSAETMKQTPPPPPPMPEPDPGVAAAPKSGGASGDAQTVFAKLSAWLRRVFDTPDHAADFTETDAKAYRSYALLCYLGVLVLIPFFLVKGSAYARFHVNQGLLFFLSWAAVNVVFGALSSVIPFFLFLLVLANFCLIGVALLYLLRVAKGQSRELPLIGKLRLL